MSEDSFGDFSEERPFKHKKRRISKERYCKKNKLGGGQFGPHQYDSGKKVCKLCGHIKKEGRNEDT